MKKKDSGRALRFQRSRTLRLGEREDARLVEHAAVAGLSVSEYMRRVFNKPKATMIGELLNYILQRQDENCNDKLAYHGAKNFITGTTKGQKIDMCILAAESVRSPMPVTHWCLSWQENEQPSHEQIDEAVDIFLQGMGLEGHQVIYAQHKNTAHCHPLPCAYRREPDAPRHHESRPAAPGIRHRSGAPHSRRTCP